jgi:multiple sugar transport system permease protein/putative aldouronate transport system permease protein
MMVKGQNIRHYTGDTGFHMVSSIWLLAALVLVLYPLIYTISCSFSSASAILLGKVFLWPVEFSLSSYQAVLQYPLILSGFLNSLFYVFGGTVVAVSLILTAAYPLSRKDLPARKPLTYFFVVTMFFSGGLIPTYILMVNLHLIGSRWVLVIGAGFSCYNMIIVKSFFQSSIPSDLLDATRIDGCGDVRFFFSFALPLATPVIAVMVLYHAVGIWNGYFSAMLYLTKPDTFSFQMILRDILFISSMPVDLMPTIGDDVAAQNLQDMMYQLRYAVIVIGALPMMVLYPFIQKYFIRGLMIGSLKD